ncbi:hypothetical protein ACIBJC_31915 [Streptomyces sp. NPDC050509]|uniref:hypothetical protein n=1 Tax=Streptomyces sp. NPDC050509 TaxID=3365620 RepID=UPI0037BDCB1E
MITVSLARPTVLLGPGSERVRVRCLARRGMLHSECEAVDHLRLSPDAHFDLMGRDGTEAAWYVLSGSLILDPDGPDPAPGTGSRPRATLGERGLLVAARGEDVRPRAGPRGAELLCLTLTPDAVARRLPCRVPDTTEEHTS